jgi:hypothetical protein
MNRKTKRSTKGIRRSDDLMGRVSGGPELWKAGVDEGLQWVTTADPDEVAGYLRLTETEVELSLDLVDGPDAVSVTVSFGGSFTPPRGYEADFPEAARVWSEPEAWLYWTGWLAGVKEAAARNELAPLIAAATERVIVMDPPRHHECPICWIERNLGVRIVIRAPGESGGGA